MHETNSQVKALALLCSPSGKINEIIHDDFGLSKMPITGKLFSTIIEPNSRDKALSLIYETKNNRLAIDFQLEVVIRFSVKILHFLGVSLGDSLLFIGADNQEDAIEFINYLQQVNNEQANEIRYLMKEKNSRRTTTGEDEKLFNELTSLNNELINLQRELTKKNTELERLNALKNQFLGMAAHDLRNPLGAIQSFSKLLMDERAGKLSGKQEKYIHIIHRSSRFMLKLIEELLDFSRVESGKLALNKTSFDFVDLARQNIQLFNPIAQNKNIKLHFQHAKYEITIVADQGKIEQVLHNLIGNAIKFSHPDSTVTIQAHEKKGQLLFSVSDHGTGITTEDQQKLFVPFQPISKNGTAGEKGTGLGLSIVKKIVEGHQGKIWLESEEEKGSTFFVSLPMG